MKRFALLLLLFFVGPLAFEGDAQCPYNCIPPVWNKYGPLPLGPSTVSIMRADSPVSISDAEKNAIERGITAWNGALAAGGSSYGVSVNDSSAPIQIYIVPHSTHSDDYSTWKGANSQTTDGKIRVDLNEQILSGGLVQQENGSGYNVDAGVWSTTAHELGEVAGLGDLEQGGYCSSHSVMGFFQPLALPDRIGDGDGCVMAQLYASYLNPPDPCFECVRPAYMWSDCNPYYEEDGELWFDQDCLCCKHISTPLLVNLSGPVSFSSAERRVRFDVMATGQPRLLPWPKGQNGWLVRDVNRNGIIDDGRELFGNATRLQSGGSARNGFAALQDLDSDKNMIFDSRDASFAEVRVWLDENGDGVSQPLELHTLSSLGILAIELDYHQSHRQVAGAVLRLMAPVHFSDRGTRFIFDVYFGARQQPGCRIDR